MDKKTPNQLNVRSPWFHAKSPEFFLMDFFLAMMDHKGRTKSPCQCKWLLFPGIKCLVGGFKHFFHNIWDNPSHWRTHIFPDGQNHQPEMWFAGKSIYRWFSIRPLWMIFHCQFQRVGAGVFLKIDLWLIFEGKIWCSVGSWRWNPWVPEKSDPHIVDVNINWRVTRICNGEIYSVRVKFHELTTEGCAE